MIKRLFLTCLLLATALLGYSYWSAVRAPVQREAQITVSGWPAAQPSLRIVLISDIHVAGPDMPPARLARIVERLNLLDADLILIAGDLISDKRAATVHYSIADAVEPLSRLRAEIGVFAVLGNHDHWRDAAALRTELTDAGITVMDNEAVVAGPIMLIGVDDEFTGHADLDAAFASAAGTAQPIMVLSHSPDIVPELPRPVALVAAGHTHCGQISLPLVGRLATASRYGERFACGLIDDDGQRVIVGAGLGTSILPLRFGVPPDYWVIELGPES